MRVLVIDDEDSARRAIAQGLRAAGAEVLEAADGEAGLASALGGAVDLVVLDLRLPGMDGETVLATLRRSSAVPVIVVSSKLHEDDRVGVLDLGADDYLVKPFTIRELEARIRAVLRRTEGDVTSAATIGDVTVHFRPRTATRGGEPAALSEAARRGEALFFSEDLECFHCHGGFAFSDSVVHARTTFIEANFHHTALYNLDGAGAYPASDRGLYEITGEARDMGRFRAPTLRNITLTAPYMHDGSAATLDDVIDHYAAGGRRIESGEDAGDGSTSPLRSEFVTGFALTAEQRVDLMAFLESLTDDDFLPDPRHGDPW